MVTTVAGRRMTDVEALMWRAERRRAGSPALLVLLGSAPEWDRLHAVHERAAALLPWIRGRVLEPAVPVGPPAWVPDGDFDLDRHLSRTRLPARAGRAGLLAFAEAFAAAPLDPGHPPWAAALVEGLPRGRAAYLLKAHPSLTGGAGDPLPAAIRPGPRSLALEELARQTLTLPLATGRLLAAGARALAHPGPAAASALRLAVSLRRAASSPVAGSPLFRDRDGASWRFGLLECTLDDLRAAAHAGGGSVTDACLAALLGGMRRYHQRHGIEIDEMPVSLPVAARFGPVVGAPAGIADPAERIAACRGLTMTLGVEPAVGGFATLAPLLSRFPGAVSAAAYGISAAADLTLSHRIGAPGPAHLAGAKVDRVYPLGPAAGSAVSAATLTRDGACCLGLTMDGTVVRDPKALVACVRAGLDEVLALGRPGPA